MELSETAQLLLEQRYLQTVNGVRETLPQLFRRVAAAAASAEVDCPGSDPGRWENEFYQVMTSFSFLPNTPTLINAGVDKAQLAACFVLPVGDSLDSIFSALKKAALLHKSGGGTGFSFSSIRPKGATISSARGTASGPVPFISVFDRATEAVKQGGVRRGANMAVLRIDHPDISAFIKAKSNSGALANFNLSVAVTDDFFDKLLKGERFNLTFAQKEYADVAAEEIWQLLANSAWLNGEPGVLFIDRINQFNPTPQLGMIQATNPCGEQPLLDYESCVLGSINLANMLTGEGQVDWRKLENTVNIAVRFLDNIVEINCYPLPELAEMSHKTRKVGLGVMGWADMLFQLKVAYNSQAALVLAQQLMQFIQSKAHQASENLAHQKGHFPEFPNSTLKKPRRNATCTTIAPTGSISLLADCSAGIEPVYLLAYKKRIMNDQTVGMANRFFRRHLKEHYSSSAVNEILTYAQLTGNICDCPGVNNNDKTTFVTALEISPQWHVKMQGAFQRYCDNAVSKTVNLPAQTTVSEVKELMLLAYQEGCKGLTVYRSGSRADQVQFI